ncbi:helix-turn-helix domain-containing protein [Microbulbifer rhizosphaerae]|uniref:AraC-like DNA-binding protein/predicted transcriptional regulator YdeE n=1 Tax=Microbulbifer rhizosphaerae TaxID=1562603 RepID=A0A7W4W7Q9_9GAMM|nr:helix-turn-helix domain-containing protein [Microbulbifer rhizosphaerae]MBB3059255.1 AraC-like DNA-binding protein/predicted transcriptional regulator YdeE [Microbulbifer rhizosphaerae]
MPRRKDFKNVVRQRVSIDSAITYIRQEYAEKLDVNILSEISHYSKFHFQRLFSEVTGETWSEYLLRVRLLNASNKLIQTQEKINDIAIGSGFVTQTGFLKAFKKYYSLTPTRYRQTYYGSEPFFNQFRVNRICSNIKEELVNVMPCSALAAYSATNLNEKSDPSVWDAIKKLCKSLDASFNTRPQLERFALSFSDINKIEHASNQKNFLAMLLVDDIRKVKNSTLKQVAIQGGVYARFFHQGPLSEHTINKILYSWFPQSGYKIDTKRPMIMMPEGAFLKDVYDRFLGREPDKKVYVYQSLELTAEQISHFCLRIYVPLLSDSLTDLQWQDISNIAI